MSQKHMLVAVMYDPHPCRRHWELALCDAFWHTSLLILLQGLMHKELA